jgi:hypothetical protein
VLESLLHPGGIGEPEDYKFDPETDVNMSEYILLVCGDLLTKEQLDTLQDSRSIEATPKHFNMSFSYLVFSISKWLAQMCSGGHGCSQKTHKLMRTTCFNM